MLGSIAPHSLKPSLSDHLGTNTATSDQRPCFPIGINIGRTRQDCLNSTEGIPITCNLSITTSTLPT